MNLTNEEKKRIADAATIMMQTFCEYRMAEDRLNIMRSLVGNVLQMRLGDEILQAALTPYMERMRTAQKEFFDALGIGEDNKEFWEYNASVEQNRRQVIEEKSPSNIKKPVTTCNPSDSCIEG